MTVVIDWARKAIVHRTLSVVAAIVFALGAAQTASPETSFVDPAGDSGAAPDITRVVVGNDAGGNVTIAVTTNQPTLAPDAALIVSIDSDQNPATGSLAGIEFVLFMNVPGSTFTMWNGTTFVPAPATTLHVSYGAGIATFQVNKSELGNTSGFRFGVVASKLVGNQVTATDRAPDSGQYAYTLAASPPPRVALGRAVTRAPGIHAGKRFSISAPVSTNANTVHVSCAAKVAGKAVHTHAGYVGGRDVCTGTVPRDTAGARLTGTETATISGGKTTSAFSFVVKK